MPKPKIKQLKRRQWFTLEATAKRLSDECEGEEEITVTDVLQIALEGDLAMSLLVHDTIPAVKLSPFPGGLGLSLIRSPLSSHEARIENKAWLGKGIYRIGFDSSSIQKYLFDEIAGTPQHDNYDGPWYVIKEAERAELGINEKELFLPIKYDFGNTVTPLEIPQVNRLVVLGKDLDEFIEKISEEEIHPSHQEEQVHPRKKNSYHKLIMALLAESKIDLPAEPYKAAGILQKLLEKNGESMSSNTLKNIVDEMG